MTTITPLAASNSATARIPAGAIPLRRLPLAFHPFPSPSLRSTTSCLAQLLSTYLLGGATQRPLVVKRGGRYTQRDGTSADDNFEGKENHAARHTGGKRQPPGLL